MGSVKTYRYVRLAIIGMALLLSAAVVYEWAQTGWQCLQPSVSAYYYTPARTVFVGALIAIGVCLVVIRGSTDGEDILLNVCGATAAVVAVVPTPDPGRCRSVPMSLHEVPADIANNVFALLVLGLAVLIGAASITYGQRRPGERLRRRTRVRFGFAAGTYLVTAGTFVGARAPFVADAHLASSFALFTAVIAVVLVNAVQYGRDHSGGQLRVSDVVNRYGVLAAVMLAVTTGLLVLGRVYGWQHAGLSIEGELVIFFALFWAIQTHELWWRGVRAASPPRNPPATRSVLH